MNLQDYVKNIQACEKIPSELQAKVIQQIVQRKGLTAGQLGA